MLFTGTPPNVLSKPVITESYQILEGSSENTAKLRAQMHAWDPNTKKYSALPVKDIELMIEKDSNGKIIQCYSMKDLAVDTARKLVCQNEFKGLWDDSSRTCSHDSTVKTTIVKQAACEILGGSYDHVANRCNAIATTGNITAGGAISATGNLNIGGTSTLKAVNATTLTTSGNTTIKGNAQVDGSTTMKALSATTITTSGNTAVNGALSVKGNTQVDGSTTMKALSATAISAVSLNLSRSSGSVTATSAVTYGDLSSTFSATQREAIVKSILQNTATKDYVTLRDSILDYKIGAITNGKNCRAVGGKIVCDKTPIKRTCPAGEYVTSINEINGFVTCSSLTSSQGSEEINMYKCPEVSSIGGGAWGFYGCTGQITNQSTCRTVEYPTNHISHCTYIGKMILKK